MLRFLRQYNKGLLVVGGVLLMVAWAIGGSFSHLSEQSAVRSRVWATVGGHDVRGDEVARTQAELRILESLGPSALAVPEAGRDVSHYYLLQKEATDAGLVGTAEDGLLSITRQLARARETNPDVMQPEQFIAAVAERSGGQPPQLVLETIAKVNGINRLVSLYDGAPRLSDRRLRSAAARLLGSVDADYVVLDARRMSAGLDWTPSEEELARQLAAHGATAPGPQSPFGYKLPNRLKLEWMVVPADAIRASVEGSDALGSIELRKHRDRNPVLFPKPADGSDDFEVVRDSVRANRLAGLVAERTAEIAKFANDQLQMPLRGVPRDGAWVKLPEDWSQRQLSLEYLADQIAQQFKVVVPTPALQTSGPQWIEPGAADRLPIVGAATSDRFGATPVRPSQYLAQLREFGGNDSFAAQAHVAAPPFRTPAGDVVVLRAFEVDPARAPSGVDEVRDRLVADVKALEQYRRLVEQLGTLKGQAERDGLLALAVANSAAVQSARNVSESDPRTLGSQLKMTPPLPGVGQAPAAIKAIVEAGAALPQGVAAAAAPESSRLFAIPLEERLLALVGRVAAVNPLPLEQYELYASTGALEQAVLGEEIRALRGELFSREAMEKRMDFKLARQIEEGEEALEQAEDGAAPSAPGAPGAPKA